MFRLNVECTKDIDELHINFSDGTSVVTNGSTNTIKDNDQHLEQESPQATARPSARQESFLDLDTDFGGVSQEVVEKPTIERRERPVKVAEELQNFDF